MINEDGNDDLVFRPNEDYDAITSLTKDPVQIELLKKEMKLQKEMILYQKQIVKFLSKILQRL